MSVAILRRIFAKRQLPDQSLPEEEFDKQVKEAVTEFENSGFLEQVSMPLISSDSDFIDKLRQHHNDVVVVKFWKRGCLPCLGLAEMFKAAEQHYLGLNERMPANGKKVYFYAVDTKNIPCLKTVLYQLVEGTPAIQAFHNSRQIGDEIMALQLSTFTHTLDKMVADALRGNSDS